jgi:hypothetical protein
MKKNEKRIISNQLHEILITVFLAVTMLMIFIKFMFL